MEWGSGLGRPCSISVTNALSGGLASPAGTFWDESGSEIAPLHWSSALSGAVLCIHHMGPQLAPSSSLDTGNPSTLVVGPAYQPCPPIPCLAIWPFTVSHCPLRWARLPLLLVNKCCPPGFCFPRVVLSPSLQEKWSKSHVWLFMTPWTLQSMEFSRPEHWSR